MTAGSPRDAVIQTRLDQIVTAAARLNLQDAVIAIRNAHTADRV